MRAILLDKIILTISTTVLILSFIITPFLAFADFNQQINYQGKLTNSSGVAVADGTYNMKFWLIASSTAATSTAVWAETRISGDKVQVTNGLFSVMLGEVSSLASVDFNQTLYLGVEIGGSGSPTWDGEMTPRKILGAVPAAFEAENAQTLAGIATTSFLRSDTIDTMEATSSSVLLTLIQNGAGKLLSIFSGVTEMFTILNNGNVGIATTTPSEKLTVIGNTYLSGGLTLTGALKDSTTATGTLGMVLKTTGTSTQWVATSTLGLGNGTFLGLTDTPSSFTANRLMFTNSGATALTDSADLTFDGTNFGVGAQNGIAFGGTRYLYASSTNDSIAFGENAGATFNSSTIYNTAIGFGAGRYASTSASDYNNFMGYQAGYNNDGDSNNLFGYLAGYNNTGYNNNIVGYDAGNSNTGFNNNLLGNSTGNSNTGDEINAFGTAAANENTGDYNNIIGYEAGYSNSGSYNNLLGRSAGSLNTGSHNNLLGEYAGQVNTGSYNDFIGYEAGNHSSGNYNALFGYGAGSYNIGQKNVLMGEYAGYYNRGSDNVYLGSNAGYNTFATNTVAVGSNALRGGAYGAVLLNNTALGYKAGYAAQTGASNNILLGYQAADNLTTGANNIVIGYDVDIASTTRSNQLNIGNLIFGTGIDGTGTTLSSGNIGIGSTTPSDKLTVIGNTYLNGGLTLTGALKDSTNATGTLGMVLQSNGTSTQWVATSSLGISSGASTFLSLTDTPSSYTANRLMFTNSGATALTDSADLTFDGTNFGVGSQNGIAFGDTRYLYASSTNDSIAFGENAGANFKNTTTDNIAIGFDAGRYASTSASDFNSFIGNSAGYNNTGSYNNLFGADAGYNNTGSDNNFIGDAAGYKNTGDFNEIIGTESGYNLQATSSTVIGSYAFRGGAGSTAFQAINNVALGYKAGYSAQTGASNNILLGYQAADNLTTGANNIVIGYDVDIASTTRSNQLNIGNLIFGTGIDGTGTTLSTGNIGIGTTTPNSKLTVAGSVDITNTATSSAAITLRDTIGGISLELRAGTSTLANTFVGLSAGSSNSTGINNSALGKFALKVNTTGSQNTANGASALATNSSGSDNTAIGSASQLLNTTGSYNTVAGSNSLVFNQTGFANSVFGNEAGYGAISQSFSSSTLMGYRAGFAITSGSRNTLLGYRAGDAITSGQGNIILGYDIDAPSATGNNQLSIGNLIFGTSLDGTGTSLSSGNIGIGSTTPSSKLTVAGSVDITNAATSSAAITLRDVIGGISLELRAGTSTLENTFIGLDAGATNSTGANNIALGVSALYSNTTGGSNTAVGWQALYSNATGTNNTASGFRSLYANLASNNTAYGYGSLRSNTIGDENTATGLSALNTNTTGSKNTANGTYAMYENIDGDSNTAFGYASLNSNVSGNKNTALGRNAGYDINTAVNTGSNTIIGYNTGRGITTGVNNTVIGANVTGLSSALSNNIIIADGAGNQRINVDSSGNVGIATTTPVSLLAMEKLTFTGAGIAGINQYLKSTNVTASAVQYGNFGYLYASNTATTTIAGNMFKIEDNTTFGNTVRGFEVQTDRGTNTLGENTALSGFARTFGVRGTTKGDAGGTYEPAGVFAETQGTTQGNAIRGYSASITTTSLLKLFQDTSTFVGTGLLMNFGNSGGSFSSTTASKFIDLQNAGTSMFTVGAYGKLTIGDGTTNNNAGIQVGYGGICVDNDGSCNASTTGRVSAVSYHTGNSDLAETYFSSENLKTGDVVYIKNGLSIGKAGENNKDNVIGVVSTKPGLLLGSDDTSLKAGEKAYPIALKGRVPVRLSNENGEIKVGDELMLSSVEGVVMKATSTGKIVGVALEDFEGSRAYSDTYINQFGDDLVDPVFEPINHDNDPRINDGCYFGGGNASGDEVCVPLVSTTTDGQIAEAEAIAKREAEERALAKLATVSSEKLTLSNGQEVKVGQIVMFVDLRHRYLDDNGVQMMSALLASASTTNATEVSETVWQRVVNLANNFVDGVLSVFTLKADKVEVKDQLCVDGVCVTGDDLRQLLNKNNNSDSGGGSDNPEPVVEEVIENNSEEENVETTVVEEPVAPPLQEPPTPPSEPVIPIPEITPEPPAPEPLSESTSEPSPETAPIPETPTP